MKEKPTETVRLDKWLWAARFYKTRALAREMMKAARCITTDNVANPEKSSNSTPC